jgi:hypothetical protein
MLQQMKVHEDSKPKGTPFHFLTRITRDTFLLQIKTHTFDA